MDEAVVVFGSGAELAKDGTPCPYGEPHAHRALHFFSGRCDGAEYEKAMKNGWRRSGNVFYRNLCFDGCDACVPIRVDASRIAAGKTQRRIVRLNGDLLLSAHSAAFEEEDYALFMDYLRSRHPEEVASFDPRIYCAAYISSPVDTMIIRYRLPEGKLVAISFLDVLPDGFSSVYFAFDPGESKRSLGVYSVFAESALLRSLGKRWYYLGFWVEGCRKMSYKADYHPHELARNGEWICCMNSN